MLSRQAVPLQVARPPQGLTADHRAQSMRLFGPSAGCYAPSAWVSAVAAMVPDLGSQGLQAALRILDAATENIKRVKALESLGEASTRSCAAAFLRAEIHSRQCDLLQQLRRLRLDSLPRERPPSTHIAKDTDPASGAVRSGSDHSMPQTLSESLQTLADVDPECLLVVRRINKLGFKAGRFLKQHFQLYGAVRKVLVATSLVRKTQSSHHRPSSMGFVHMASAVAVHEILAMGGEQEVQGCLIRVQRFDRHDAFPCENGETPEEALALKDSSFGRQISSRSAASTRASASSPTPSDETGAVRLETQVRSF